MGAVVPAIIAAKRKQLIRALRARHATSPGAAVPESMLPDCPPSIRRHLEWNGVLRRTPDGLYLDEAGLGAYQRRQGIGLLVVVVLAIVAFLVLQATR